ncbi:MAG: family 43 glycosylhydrolase, partial [Prevotellaceae bacterium]|nr:family 43 glycosylhydrolase [Prevotellaceae bacterium]
MLLALSLTATVFQAQNKYIINGIPWFDNRGQIINAHGACIVEEQGRYYLFGEYKSDSLNRFNGFSCYSSADLVNWTFERIVLPVQPSGLLGPNRVGERVKVMKCPATGEYVMYMHTDDMKYTDPHIGYATCREIAGDYRFRGALCYQGKPIRRWDMGTFQDTDGQGYLLIHHGYNYRLSDDYRSAVELLPPIKGAGESPALFKQNDRYYLLYSNLTSWEKNDNFYFTASSMRGPWTKHNLFCPKGSLTWNSQTTFVFPLKHGNDTIPLFMGDRWSFPRQASAATYVWMPMQVKGEKLSIPHYWQCWDTNTLKPVDAWRGWKEVQSHWASQQKDDRFEVSFTGTRAAIKG